MSKKSARRQYSNVLMSSGAASASSSSSYQSLSRSPFGPSMAQGIFEVYEEYDDCFEVYNDCTEQVGQEDMFSGQLESHHYIYQASLPLETTRELEDRLRQSIKKFECSYNKMSLFALKWHYLMEEAEENPQIMKMFKDLQMIRRLNGSDRV